MKKILIVIVPVFFLVFSAMSQSQRCSIDYSAVDSDFMYPPFDTTACIEQGLPYNATIQINMPGMFHGILQLDSLFVDSITGLPSGINWSSYPSSPFVLYGDSSGCVTFSGTTNADTGTYPLTFYCHATVSGESATENLSYQQLTEVGDAPIPFYDLSLIMPGDTCHPELYYYETTATGLPPLTASLNWSVFPNPVPDGAGGKVQMVVNNEMIGDEIEIFDESGKRVYQSIIRSVYSEINLNLAAGIYLAHIHSANNSFVKKLVKL